MIDLRDLGKKYETIKIFYQMFLSLSDRNSLADSIWACQNEFVNEAGVEFTQKKFTTSLCKTAVLFTYIALFLHFH